MSGSSLTVAEALLLRLGKAGVPYLFANAGTDAAPLIEAYAHFDAERIGPVPQPVTVAHEMAAVSMAHGHAMATGVPSAVFLHVSVGTANAASGIMNASRQRIPMLVMAGRTPVLADGSPGSRDMYIHWAQESFDQASMVREYTRWDYELRYPRQVNDVVDRALAVATADPAGPVYLSLPRELLAARAAPAVDSRPPRSDPASTTAAEQSAIARVADLVAGSGNLLVITNSLGRDSRAVAALVEFAEAAGAGVVEVFRERMSFPSSHPQHLGFDAAPLIEDADLLIVVEADVPWFPQDEPAPDVPVVHIGLDPIRRDYPMWNFPIHIALGGCPSQTLDGLTAAVKSRIAGSSLQPRLSRLAAQHEGSRADARHRAKAASSARPIDPAFLSRRIGDALAPDGIVVNEYDAHSDQLRLDRPGGYYGPSSVSGLGWGFGAALGVKLGEPDRTVVCALGDGAYIFSNPLACHLTAEQLGLALLVVVFNNSSWKAVRTAVQRIAPGGWAESSGNYPLTDLSPSPAFAEVASACGAYAEGVDDPAELQGALERALRQVSKGRQALLDVRTT
ncbi:MAG: thiamine pyrophosphate-requiring protein [bacterium]|nr:thiamine pyrophosphate-requiring protein [bacterium]MDE0352142.1 thiamine pyrophosphate-requiring protein [bacterium]